MCICAYSQGQGNLGIQGLFVLKSYNPKYTQFYPIKVIVFLDILGAVQYICGSLKFNTFAPVAQLDRALDSGSKGWGFDSLQAYLNHCKDGWLIL